MRDIIQSQLTNHLDSKLVDELLKAYSEAKRNYYLGGLRLSAVEGGRFCEAAFRLLQQITTSQFTPLGNQLNTEQLIQTLANLPSNSSSDSIRIHIPRALRLVYDVRNKRDAAHLADGIDPNQQDAILVISILDWILAEFIRIYHNVTADEAHKIVDTIVTRSAPIIQDFNGFLKILNPKVKPSDQCLILLYQCGANGATIEQLSEWSPSIRKDNLLDTLGRLNGNKGFVHFDRVKYYITRTGEKEVEIRRLIEPN